MSSNNLTQLRVILTMPWEGLDFRFPKNHTFLVTPSVHHLKNKMYLKINYDVNCNSIYSVIFTNDEIALKPVFRKTLPFIKFSFLFDSWLVLGCFWCGNDDLTTSIINDNQTVFLSLERATHLFFISILNIKWFC